MSFFEIKLSQVRSSDGRSFNWRRVLGYGLLFGIACTALESFALPLGQLRFADLLRFTLQAATGWAAIGAALASTMLLLGPRLTSSSFAPVLVSFALVASVAWTLLNQVLFGTSWLAANTLHLFWGCLCYGGVLMTVWQVSQRQERTRALLARAEIARQRSEAALSSAQLLALQGQIDPSFLLRVMTEVEHHYAARPAAADRLLDALVSFLRAAMPGVRSGRSTLGAELSLATQYVRLVAAVEPGREVRVVNQSGMPDLRFPPLLLLPVLDAIWGAPGGAVAKLQVAAQDGHCVLSLAREGLDTDAWLPVDLVYRLRVGLTTLYGDAWNLELHRGAGTPAFILTLPVYLAGERPASPSRGEAPCHQSETPDHG